MLPDRRELVALHPSAVPGYPGVPNCTYVPASLRGCRTRECMTPVPQTVFSWNLDNKTSARNTSAERGFVRCGEELCTKPPNSALHPIPSWLRCWSPQAGCHQNVFLLLPEPGCSQGALCSSWLLTWRRHHQPLFLCNQLPLLWCLLEPAGFSDFGVPVELG